MATTEENLRTYLLSVPSIKAAVRSISYNIVPQDKDAPYIFFQQAGAGDDAALGDSARVPNRPRYDIECWADSPSEAITIKNLLQANLHLYRGAIGDATAKGIFAEDVNDDYVANGGGEDEGLHSAALNAEVVL